MDRRGQVLAHDVFARGAVALPEGPALLFTFRAGYSGHHFAESAT